MLRYTPDTSALRALEILKATEWDLTLRRLGHLSHSGI